MPRATKLYNLQVINPRLCQEWHPTKNGSLTPIDVTPYSNKKVWWVCDKNHEWMATVDKRSNGRGCPYCRGQAACDDNCLEKVCPEVAKEWHPIKNGKLSPRDITKGSSKKVWWICEKGHEWKTAVRNRTTLGNSCPYCWGRYATKNSNLQNLNPELAKEWHPTKNDNLTPKDVTPYSNKKVWWMCDRKHEWEAKISNRSRGNGCPYCISATSQLELRFFTEYKYLFKNVTHRMKIEGHECDIFVPCLKFGIEIDSLYWHKYRVNKDLEKTKIFKSMGIYLIRLREKGLPQISNNDIVYTIKHGRFKLIEKTLKLLLENVKLNDEIIFRINKYLNNSKIANDKEYKRLLYKLPSPLPGYSLYDTNKSLAKEWHKSKNGSLTPNDVMPYSHHKVWWICEKGHEWNAKVAERNRGGDCPYCHGRDVCDDNCLAAINSNLAKEWHPTKNGNLTPKDVRSNSNKKVWWICKKKHEWSATVQNRNHGTGCPYCRGQAACDDNCLSTLNPELAKEWHPIENGNLTPNNVTLHSNKKVWWVCERNHEWRATVSSRTYGTGCPYCSGRAACDDNCLSTLNPELAKEWHPTKNKNLTPNDVTQYSNKKVWWICKRNHEWSATVANRTYGKGCPYCSGRRKW